MTVTADQLLHGYADGHRLLAASVDLPAPAQRLLLVHSDALPSTQGQRALSSLNLPDAKTWALTATWRAEEMSRPGSVWSHTLLLDWHAVSSLQGSAGLMAALRRPEGPADLARYRQPLPIDDVTVEPSDGGHKLIEALLLAYYGWPDQPAAVLSEQLEEAELALLAVWEQQWSRLRLSSTFATRPRVASDQGTTVQVAAGRARGRPAMLVIDAAGPLPEPRPTWLEPLLGDIYRSGDVRTFLRRYGPDGSQGRSDMTLLVELQQRFSASEHPRESFEPLAERYPSPLEMARLKREALERNGQAWAVSEQWRVLTALRFHQNVHWQALSLGQRLAELWPKNGQVVIEALRLGCNASDQALADELLGHVADKAEAQLLADLADEEEVVP